MTVIRHVDFQGPGARCRLSRLCRGRGGAAGVDGWVRNRRDGTVEAVFAGDAKAVEDMIAACRKGSYAARVDGIEVRDGREDEFALRGNDTFAVLPTV